MSSLKLDTPATRVPNPAHRTELWLIRHAESTGNRDGVLQGQEDLPLSPLGLRQARAVADRLGKSHRKTAFVALYTSDLERARETADSVGMACNLTPQLDKRLREIDTGQWSGLTTREIASRFPTEWAAWQSRDPHMRRGGGESYADVQQRIAPVLQELADRHPGGRVLVVSHGGVLRTYVAKVMDLPLNRIWHLSIGNTSITRIRPNEPAIGGSHPRPGRILSLNDCTHTEGVAMVSGEI
jgi:2,3-bisphosphoglycerate-dependent phosphoglycerate mutase